MRTKNIKIKQKSFGFHQQKEVFVLSLENDHGMRLRVTNFGASIMSLDVPDISGGYTNVVAGFDSITDYIQKSKNKESKFLGASIGRYAGRISNKKIEINNIDYPLYHEEGVHLHGGEHGFDESVWEIAYIDDDQSAITLSYQSEDMEEGYPGNLNVKVIYQLTNDNELKITYHAVSDQDTIVNLTNHAYYNLNGEDSIKDHTLQLNCSKFVDVDEKQLPTGILKPVVGTKYDFLVSKGLHKLEPDNIIDNAFVFDPEQEAKATLMSERTGIRMDILTNQPAVVIYTVEEFPDWNFRKGIAYTAFPAICFETQNFPDAPNYDHFPSAFLKAGEFYENSSTFRFSKMV